LKFDIEAIEKSTTNTVDVVVGHWDDEEKDGDGKVTKEATKVGFKVLGPASEEFAAVKRDIEIFNVKEAALRKSVLDLTTDDGAAVIVDGGDKRQAMLIEKCVVDWFGFTTKGKAAAFSKENLARVLKASPMWRRRIVNAIDDEAAFIAG
jgi:hypothetical protein